MEPSDARKLKALESENSKLKKLLSEQMLDNNMLRDGRRFRILTVVDDFTKENVALIQDTSTSGLHVTRELDLTILDRGLPKTIFLTMGRSSQFTQSQRLQNLHRLRQNQPVTESENNSDFFTIEASSEPDALRKITEIVKNRLPIKFKYNPIRDIQVVCQKSAGEMGTNALNRMLQEQLNPIENNSFVERFGCRYRDGDKVILNENNLDKNLMAMR